MSAATRSGSARETADSSHSKRCRRRPCPPSRHGRPRKTRSLVRLEQLQAHIDALRHVYPEMQIRCARHHPTTCGADEEPLLDQKGLDDILERTALLAHGRGDTV